MNAAVEDYNDCLAARESAEARLKQAVEVARNCPDSHWGPWIADRIEAIIKEQTDAAHE
jgi:hypothetical protein